MNAIDELKEAIQVMNDYTKLAQELTELDSIAKMWTVPQVAEYMGISENAAREFLNSEDLRRHVPVFRLGKGLTINNLALITYTMGIKHNDYLKGCF